MLPITKSVANAGTVMRQQVANKSLFAMAMGQFNKIYHGSETPYVKPDPVLERVIKEGRYTMPKVYAKTVFLREKARRRVVENNEHVRKLETKVTGGAFSIKSMENRF